MNDVHCHLLAGVDDGPATAEETRDLCRALVRQGVVSAAATAHLPNRAGLDPWQLVDRVADLRADLAREGIPLTVQTGAEVTASAALEAGPAALGRVAIGGRYLLFEGPLSGDLGDLEVVAERIWSAGLIPLLAHVERFRAARDDPGALLPLVRDGLVAQLSAAALTSDAPPALRVLCERLLASGVARVVASDAHGAGRRPPRMAEARAALDSALGTATAQWLTRLAPGAVLRGEPLPPRPVAAGRTAPAARHPRRWVTAR